MDDNDSDWKTITCKRKNPYIPKGKKKKNKTLNGLDIEDLNNYKNYEESHSNILKMQIDELLKERNKKTEDIEFFLNNLKEAIFSLSESVPCMIKDFSTENDVEIPIKLFPENEKGNFKFIPPSKIIEIGSYSFETLCSSSPIIDIAVEIPKTCWQGMDFLNYRYHRKRAFYLTYIADSLINSNLVSKMEFVCEIDDKPDLIIFAEGIKNFSFRVSAFPCEEAFKESRFHPEKNNIRASWFCRGKNAVDEPTPFYNSTVLADLLLIKLNEEVKKNMLSNSLKEAIILLKLWASKKKLTFGYGKFNGFILTCFVVDLLKKKKISIHMNNLEIFKYAILELSVNSLNKNLFKDTFEFYLLYFVSDETFSMIKHEAKLALRMLECSSLDVFTYLFLEKISLVEKFDYLLHLKNIKLELLPKICEKLKVGLSNKILLMDVTKNSCLSWPVTSPPPKSEENLITIGFLLNPEVPLSNLEKGPLANDPQAKVFQEFWGNQSELRRFQDGSIREAVFWPAVTLADKREVFCTILKDILERHFKISKNEITVNGVETNSVLQVPNLILSKDFSPYGTGEESHAKITQSYIFLCKQLRTLNLPLLIASIQGTSPAFRFSEVFPPLSVYHEVNPRNCFVDGNKMKLKNNGFGVPPYTPALKAIIHFEGSGKWPNDVEALKRVKAAFHIKIADLIKSQCSLIAVPFVTHTDIFKDGYVFRFEVACHKEISLLKQVHAPDGSIKIKDTKESLELEVSTEILPKLNGTLHGLHQQHNSYGTACRLAKRWISSQLKHKFIHDITIELLIAYLFVHPEPFTCPNSPQVAFIRFLSLLVTHNWVAMPLIINFNTDFKTEDIEEISSSFTSQRSTLPSMVIVTPFDKRGNLWTKNKPSVLILKRIIILAEASLKTLNNAFLKSKLIDIKAIFRPPMHSFDVLIHLKRREISQLSYAIDVKIDDPLPVFKPYECDIHEVFPITDFDPVQKYLDELIVNFGNWAVFLNDKYGGDVIAVKWKTAAFNPENAKISHGCKMIPKVEEILENFKILGEGLILEIQCKTENWQLP